MKNQVNEALSDCDFWTKRRYYPILKASQYERMTNALTRIENIGRLSNEEIRINAASIADHHPKISIQFIAYLWCGEGKGKFRKVVEGDF